MVSRKLLGIWAFLDVCLLAAGGVTIAFSMVWRQPNVLVNMVFSNADLTGNVLAFRQLASCSLHSIAGLVLGIALLITFVISIGAIIQPNHVTVGLVMLNWLLVIDAIAVIVVGGFIWFYTLQERSNFQKVFDALSVADRIFVQDDVRGGILPFCIFMAS
jgi:hypothetical protein